MNKIYYLEKLVQIGFNVSSNKRKLRLLVKYSSNQQIIKVVMTTKIVELQSSQSLKVLIMLYTCIKSVYTTNRVL